MCRWFFRSMTCRTTSRLRCGPPCRATLPGSKMSTSPRCSSSFEIFGSQDEERRSNLLTALRTQESRFPQILLISHIAEIQGEFANTLMVETGAGEGSRVREAA